MFNLKTLLVLILTMTLQSSMAFAGASKTQSFKLSVTIPAAVTMAQDIQPIHAAAQMKEKTSQIIQQHQTVRNNTPVTVRSTVIL